RKRRGRWRCRERMSGWPCRRLRLAEIRGLVAGAPPPPDLPHQGGGVAPRFLHYFAQSTGQHLPLDGGGWEGVIVGRALAPSHSGLCREDIAVYCGRRWVRKRLKTGTVRSARVLR